jgi:hypothetical protein
MNKINDVIVQMSLVAKKNIYEIFVLVTLLLASISYYFNDSISTISCLVVCVLLIMINKFKDNIYFKEFVQKWL